jgi:hypothetical protein
MSKPIAIDLYCGLGGWTEGLLAEGYDVIGFDIERHAYGDHRYPAQLVLQDVRTIHGAQFRDASLIVASSPCQEFSRRAMPWKSSKALTPSDVGQPEPDWWQRVEWKPEAKRKPGVAYMTQREMEAWEAWRIRYPSPSPDLGMELFAQAARIQREAIEASTCWACADWHITAYCDACHGTRRRFIPMVQENVRGAQKWVGRARWHYGSYYLWGDVPALMPMTTAAKNDGGSWFNVAHNTASGHGQNPVNLASNEDGVKQHKSGRHWFADPDSISGSTGSKSSARKEASARIAKIPLPLARHIARAYYPNELHRLLDKQP